MSITERRRARPNDTARHQAQMHGGEPEDYQEQPAYKEWDDKKLTQAGFQQIATYPYRALDGTLLYEVLRYEHKAVKGEKRFLQRMPTSETVSDTAWFAKGGFVKVLYRWQEVAQRAEETVHFTEGEKDADKLAGLGLLATTVAGQNWSDTCAQALADRDVLIYEDNDDDGRENATAAAKQLQDVARSIRIVRLPELPRKGDVSDWLDAGRTKDELLQICAQTPEWMPDGNIIAQPHDFPDERDIPRWDFLYGKHTLRGEVVGTAAMGGTGKSNMANIEALAMASGRQLLHDTVARRPLRVVLVNLEDKRPTMVKRIAAIMRHYGIAKGEIGDRLILLAKGEIKIKIARQLRNGNIDRNEQAIKQLTNLMLEKQADVLSIDSFIRTHGCSENDNSAIQEVVECFEEVAGAADCGVHLWHHTRKMGGDKATVESSRGAQSFIDACRSIRILETMTRKECDDLKTIMPDIGEPGFYFRAFNGKRNFAPSSDQSDWFRYVSVKLRNWTSEFEDDGDNVGVVTPWQYPSIGLATLTTTDIDRALAAVRAGGPWRANSQSTAEPWIGIPIARALALDLLDKRAKVAVAKLVKDWLAAGLLQRVMRPDQHGDQREYIEATRG